MRTRLLPDSDTGWLLALLALHLLATLWFLPANELWVDKPLFHIDYPVHTHRVAVYSAGFHEGGLPWGYDPRIGAGLVVSPYRDIGAKPMQVLGLLLPGVAAGTVVRLFLFFTVLMVPLGCLLACRLLKLEPEIGFWTTAAAASFLWLSWTIQIYLGWGLASFVAAAALSPVVLTLFVRFGRRPGLLSWSLFALTLSALLLLHIQGPWSLALPLAILVLVIRPLDWKWRVAAIVTPLVAVGLNAFWLAPAVRGSKMPLEPLNPSADYPHIKHLTLTALSDFTSQIDGMWIVTRLVVLILAIAGLTHLWRRNGPLVAWTYGLATVWTFSLSICGSFMPFFERYQPVRFVVPALILLAVPLGAGVAAFTSRLGPTRHAIRGGFLVLAIVLSIATYRGPKPLPVPAVPDALDEFIASHTEPDDRLAIQSRDGLDKGGFEARAMALAYHREVIGCTYPKVAAPAQFLGDRLLGRLLEQWTPAELEAALRRWGVDWVFAQTTEARDLVAEALGATGEPVGRYQAFAVPRKDGRFLVGSGEVRADVNRIELGELQPEEGLVVLRYRFHPAWKAVPAAVIEPYPIPEDRAGFIALRNPPPELILEFDTRAMLTADWPESADRPTGYTPEL